MKILHTSDWHLGRTLYEMKRHDEFAAFLDWLVNLLASEKIDVLLIAGDIFDSTMPGNSTQQLYYHFLARVSNTGCRHVVIIGGNHDSATFLNAPKNLLHALNIHVVGAITDIPTDEVFILKDTKGAPEAIVCAVPFLRDRDIRTVEAGESPDDKNRKLLEGIANHYSLVVAEVNKQQDEKHPVPVIGMGHLFTREGKTTEGDGLRELYIGTLAHVDGKSISDGFDYMALGHLHMAQQVSGSETIRYSGSPIPMSFSEAGQDKKVVVIEFVGQIPSLTEHPVPSFQELVRISGDMESISEEIEGLKSKGSNAWLEIVITSELVASNITTHFNEILEGSDLKILKIKNARIAERALTPLNENETLDMLTDSDVFTRCLDAYKIDEPQRSELTLTYQEAIASLPEKDTNAN